MSQTGAFVVFSIWYQFVARPGAYFAALEPGHAMTRYQMPRAGLGTGHKYRLLLQYQLQQHLILLVWIFGLFSSSVPCWLI